jgi:hypothetical protein
MAELPWFMPASYDRLSAVTDVQQIMDRLTVILLAKGWTESPAGTFRTPNDAAGRWYKLAFVRASATRLQCTMTDDIARASIQREMQIVSGHTVDFHYSSRYLYIVNQNAVDFLWVNMLTLWPESDTVHDKYCVFHGGRDNTGAATTQHTLVMQTINASNVYVDVSDALRRPVVSYLSAGAMPLSRHISGRRRWWPAEQVGADTAGQRIRGRLYNALVMSSAEASIGSEYNTVPVGGGATGIFRIVNIPISQETVLAVRKV